MVQQTEDLVCPICALDFKSFGEFEQHKASDLHRERWLNRQYRTGRKKFVTDQKGLVVETKCQEEDCIVHDLEHSTVEISPVDEQCNFSLILHHNGNEDVYMYGIDILNKMYLMESKSKISISDEYNMMKREKVVHFKKGSKYDVKVTVYPGTRVRTVRIPVVFHFDCSATNTSAKSATTFYIGRDLVIKADSYDLKDFGNFIHGVFPELKDDDLEKNLPLKWYDIPSWFQRVAFNNDPKEIHMAMHSSPILKIDNHHTFFKTLLWLEELQLHLDIQFYSKKGVTLKPVPSDKYSAAKCLEMREDGLAENRPCVMERDQVFICRSVEVQPAGIAVQWYQGIVHKVNNASVYLAFEQHEFMLQFDESMKFDVEYTICRYPEKVCHRGLELCRDQLLQNFLFPPTPSGQRPLLPHITPYNQKLANNMEQLQAVKHIIAGSSLPSPYLVFGPPGTGKTVTVVEAIKQILYHDQTTHVLACAPSNSAADIIAERLLDNLNGTHVLRLFAKSRSRVLGNLSDRLVKASNFKGSEVHFPSCRKIMEKRVVICTFITAARIASATFPVGHFSHVILDEVGHATEPEALVAVAGILSPTGQLVLAGDPHQLGPVVRNLQAVGGGHIFPKTGLDMSYLERLMSMKIYQQDEKGHFNPRLVTKLLNNYRSHGDILKVSNELFYNSELKVRGNPSEISSLCSLPFLPKQGFPLIFHATQGQDMLEPHSPSFHNPAEVTVIVKYVKELLNCKKPKVKPQEIGIITPYRLQVEKLRVKMRNEFHKNFADIKVGSVEDFQGEERRVILISTVRASKTHLAKDEIFKLGFLRNPKRFNVAITRAQALLIVVGCPQVLQLDNNWRRLIEHIIAGGGYVGARVPPPAENLDTIVYRMQQLDTSPLYCKISEKQIVEAPAFNSY